MTQVGEDGVWLPSFCSPDSFSTPYHSQVPLCSAELQHIAHIWPSSTAFLPTYISHIKSSTGRDDSSFFWTDFYCRITTNCWIQTCLNLFMVPNSSTVIFKEDLLYLFVFWSSKQEIRLCLSMNLQTFYLTHFNIFIFFICPFLIQEEGIGDPKMKLKLPQPSLKSGMFWTPHWQSAKTACNQSNN